MLSGSLVLHPIIGVTDEDPNTSKHLKVNNYKLVR